MRRPTGLLGRVIAAVLGREALVVLVIAVVVEKKWALSCWRCKNRYIIQGFARWDEGAARCLNLLGGESEKFSKV